MSVMTVADLVESLDGVDPERQVKISCNGQSGLVTTSQLVNVIGGPQEPEPKYLVLEA